MTKILDQAEYGVEVGVGEVNYVDRKYFSAAVVDETGPHVDVFYPLDGMVGVSFDFIYLVFNENIKWGSGVVQIRVKSATGSVLEEFDVNSGQRAVISDNTLTLRPSIGLSTGIKYYVVLPSGVLKDLAGNNNLEVNFFDFTTAGTPDTTAPTVTDFTPDDGALGVDVDDNIDVVFNEPVQKGSGKIEIRADSATGALFESFDVADSTALSVVDNKLTINPSTNLSGGVQYFVTFPKGIVTDRAGNDYVGTITYDFKTIDTTAPALVESSPISGATGVAVAANIVLTFNEVVQKGTGTIELRDNNTDTIIERFDVANSTKLRFVNNQVIIDPTNNLAQGVTYSVIVSEGAIKDLSGNVFTISQDFDYHFTTLDQAPPAVISFSPSDGSTSIATNTNISLMFNEAVQWGNGSIQLRTASATGPIIEAFNTGNGGNAVIDGNFLTLDPYLNLKPNTLYFVTIPSGAVKDMAGNPYAGIATYDFTTAPDTKPPVVQVYKPADGAGNVPLDGGIEFSFDEVIFPGTGTIEIRVGSRLGPVVESFNVTNSPYLQFSENLLTILPNTELEPQTRYFVVFPRGSIKDAYGNLYLGISTYDFVTADTVAPVTIDISPNIGASDVERNRPIELTFSEPIKAAIGNIEIRLGSSATSPLIEAVNINSNKVSVVGNSLKLSPGYLWALDADYFIHIPAGSIKDLAGNNFGGVGFKFHTTNNSAGKFYATTGNDVINGTQAVDTAVYNGRYNNFIVSRVRDVDGAWYLSGQGDDLLKNIERIQFSDKKIALDMGLNQNTGKAMLFWSVMNPQLIESPDWLGLVIGLFDAGRSMPEVFNWAINTVESLVGPVSDDMLIQWVKNNIDYCYHSHGFLSDPISEDYLIDLLNGGTANYGRAEFLSDVARLDVAEEYVRIVGSNHQGIEYI